jgi:acyl transferase domain-containing protein
VVPPADDREKLPPTSDRRAQPSVGGDENFFEIGGHSLLAVKVFRRSLTPSGAARSPTSSGTHHRTFARLAAAEGTTPSCHAAPSTPLVSDIAIVGMAGRFPGAPDVDTLWQRVRAGEDCLVDLDPSELIAAGLPASLVDAPDYVRRAGVMADIDQFDPAFFGIGKRDAAIMDPQHRHLLEVVWEAIESSGYVPERFDGAIGVFAGCGVNTYLINNLLSNPQMVDQIGWFLLRHTANDKDFLSTGISYRLDLRGPSINVQTACSTSLVAIHLAVQSLLSFECDMAIAGGSTIDIPSGRGYTYQEEVPARRLLPHA